MAELLLRAFSLAHSLWPVSSAEGVMNAINAAETYIAADAGAAVAVVAFMAYLILASAIAGMARARAGTDGSGSFFLASTVKAKATRTAAATMMLSMDANIVGEICPRV